MTLQTLTCYHIYLTPILVDKCVKFPLVLDSQFWQMQKGDGNNLTNYVLLLSTLSIWTLPCMIHHYLHQIFLFFSPRSQIPNAGSTTSTAHFKATNLNLIISRVQKSKRKSTKFDGLKEKIRPTSSCPQMVSIFSSTWLVTS